MAPTPSSARHRPRQLALAEISSAEPSLDPSIALRQLWLCIHLPMLSLEAVVDDPEPAAVFEEFRGVRKVLQANAAAGIAGIEPGQTVNAALALLPALKLEERSPERETEVLEELAAWSEAFTSFVCIEPPDVLLLEIAGSLSLFGGVRALRQSLMNGLGRQGFHAGVSIAPTPLAATWLARAGRKTCIRDPRNLVGRLAPLPLECLAWPEAVYHVLQGMGVSTIGETLRLPRQGFAKRFGAGRLIEFDRALGRLPDPRAGYRSPEHFIADVDLGEEQSDAGLILQACRELLTGLERFLLHRQTATQQIGFSFFHLQAHATHLELGGMQPSRDAGHWSGLLEIRFEQLVLPAPVIAVRLCSDQGRPFTATTPMLSFDPRGQDRKLQTADQLAERLKARIGDGAVHGVMAVAEHRPQYAWRIRDHYSEVPRCASGPAFRVSPHAPELLAGIHRTGSLVLRRPLWVLEIPLRLEVRRQLPWYGGLLELLDGPERIETGWWDDDGIARDYYVAINPQRIHLWVYRDRGRDRRWYLHGMFG